MKKKAKKSYQIENRKARFDYTISDEIEAGLVLEGREVKSLRLGRGSLIDSFVHVTNGEAFLVNADIPGYVFSDLTDYDSRRRRKLLLNKKEIEVLEQKLKGTGFSVVPLKIYPKAGVFKVLLGLARGKKQYEKREVLRRRDLDREAKREQKLATRR